MNRAGLIAWVWLATSAGAQMTRTAAPADALTQRERALQYLNRFTFGPRPGDVDRVVAMGVDRWLAQQLEPSTISDVLLEKRLTDYPTLTMSPAQVLGVFPDYGTVEHVADGKRPYPTDPLLLSAYQVQVYKLRQEREAGLHPLVELTEAQRAAKKEHATRLAREVLAVPKAQRFAAISALAPEDRIAIASDDVQGGLRDQIFAGFTARERETAYSFQGGVGDAYCAFDELAQSRELRQVLSERQLQEVMTDFWFNHFNIYQPGGADAWYTTSFERDTIRTHALGKFRDLLLATAESPAMLVYLDNWVSTGPHSAGNGIDPEDPDGKPIQKGLNENYGREVMELHTVGTGAGYSQEDVRALSAMLTGWTVDHPSQGGGFRFCMENHEPGTKEWFGYRIDEHGEVLAGKPVSAEVRAAIAAADAPVGMRQGVTALILLAASPQAARFISTALAQRFVADRPPEELVDRMAASYLASDGISRRCCGRWRSLRSSTRGLILRNKVKTPAEFVASVYRATATDVYSAGPIVGFLTEELGEAPYKKLDPDGYGSTADRWMNTKALQSRLNFADAFTRGQFANQPFDGAHLLAVGTGRRVGLGAVPVFEASILGGRVSARTDEFVRRQVGLARGSEGLNLLAALLIGSPEFQLR